MISRVKLLSVGLAATLAAGSIVALAPAASADPPVVLTMFDQATADGPAGDSMSQGLWGDYSQGVPARPYVQSLSVTNNDIVTQVVSDGSTSGPSPTAGDLAAVIAPVNLCKTGQTENCYESPNRVAITLGSQGNNEVSRDLTTVTGQTVNASSIIDMTVRLNTLGQSLRWTHANGDLLYWETSDLGTPDASLRIRFRPAIAPEVDWSSAPSNGCSATPIFNCDIQRSDADYLGASLLLSLDDTLDPSLTGAVFATERAFLGFLFPGGTSTAPALDFQLASTHFDADGALNSGSLKAFIPASALVNLYGLLPSDAAATMQASRSGSSGTNNAPTFSPWNAGSHGSDGLLVSVTGITFSTPKYRVVRNVAAASVSGQVKSVMVGRKRASRTVVTIGGAPMATCARYGCLVQVRRIPSARSAATISVASVAVRARSKVLTLAVAKLPKRSRFLVRIAATSGPKRGKVIGTALAQVR